MNGKHEDRRCRNIVLGALGPQSSVDCSPCVRYRWPGNSENVGIAVMRKSIIHSILRHGTQITSSSEIHGRERRTGCGADE